jgi:hypothetical protein
VHYNDLKNLDPIYSRELGRGLVLNVTWRKDNQLLMCYFKKSNTHIWITSDEISGGREFSFVPLKIKSEDLKENVVKNKPRSFSFEDY